jgi:hypothetical protein
LSKVELEANIEADVIGYALLRGFERRKVRWLGRRGAPDSLFLDLAGQAFPFLIEFKRKGKKPRPDQLRENVRLRKARFNVYVCDNLEDGKRIIDAERKSASRIPTPRDQPPGN